MRNFFEPNKLPKKINTYALLIALVFTIIINIGFSLVFSHQNNKLLSDYQNRQRTAVNITDLFISDRFVDVYEELNIIRNSSEMTQYLNHPKDPKAADEVEKMFVRYANSKNGLTQIRIIDELGDEIVRVNKVGTNIEEVDEADLQNKFDRYYFQHSIEIENDQIYVSDFDLNIENGIIVVPYEPTIRFAIKLVDKNENLKGIIILNFDGEKYFSVINRYENLDMENLEIGILDLNNYWSLNHAEMTDLDEIVLTVKSNQSDQMRDIFEKVDNHGDMAADGQFKYKSNYFFYKKIHEIDEARYVFEGKEFSWYFVSFFDYDKIVESNHPYFHNRFLIQAIGSLPIFFLLFMVFRLMEQKKNQQILLLTSAYISNNTRDGILVLGKDYEVVYCNNVFEDIYGYKLQELLNHKITEFFDGNIHKADMANESGELWNDNVWNRTKTGNLILKNLTIKEIRDNKENLIYYIGIYSSPAESNSFSRDLEKSEYHSSLIYQSDIESIGHYIDEMEKDHDEYMAITVQLMDESRKLLESSQSIHGKFVNEGEQELRIDLGYNLIAIPRSNLLVMVKPVIKDLTASQGEIFIKPEEIFVERTMKEIDGLLKKLQMRMGYSNFEFKYQTGVAISNLRTESGSDLVQNSLIALEALTKYKKSSYLVYNDKHFEYIKYENMLKEELKNAFLNKEFFVVYQPQFDVKTNAVIGFEALVRWQNERLGEVSPAKFIPVLEETEHILLLSKTVLTLVMEDLAQFDWKRNPSRVSINLSSKEFTNKKLMNEIIEMINMSGIEGITFCLEITETTLIENLEIVNEIIQLLHKDQIEISIDDFGTGYSSLGYLKQLLTDELKIDRMFIMDYPERDEGKIIKAIIGMGREIGMNMIVEGVETIEQLDLIRELKCEAYQGYYGSRPTTLEAVYQLNAQKEASKN